MDDSNRNVEDAQRPYAPGPRQAHAERPQPTTGLRRPMRASTKGKHGVSLPDVPTGADGADLLREHLFGSDNYKGDELPLDTQMGESTYEPQDAAGAPQPRLHLSEPANHDPRVDHMTSEELRVQELAMRANYLDKREDQLEQREEAVRRAEGLLQDKAQRLDKRGLDLQKHIEAIQAREMWLGEHERKLQAEREWSTQLGEELDENKALSFGPEDIAEDAEKVARDKAAREAILERALELTMGDRNRDYGDPYFNHFNIAGLWNAYISVRRDSHDWQGELDAEDVALMMALLKLTRIGQRRTDDTDSHSDLAAYAAIAGECRDRAR